jgi:hypothetical protein
MKKTLSASIALLVVYAMSGIGAAQAAGSGRSLATITGTVRDSKGSPLAGAVVSLLKEGAETVVKQTRSGDDGNFSAKVPAGRYDLRAVADGFNEVVFTSVQVKSSEELVYRFNLIPIGSGRTAPEKRRDRDNQRWVLSSAQGRRSIFQAREGEDGAIAKIGQAEEQAEEEEARASDDVSLSPGEPDHKTPLHSQGIVETYAATSANSFAPSYTGVNFAFSRPTSSNLDFIFVGQTGVGPGAPQRLEVTTRARAGNHHTLNFVAGGMRVSTTAPSVSGATNDLGQVSMRAVDEWVVRDGIVLVVGLDYSRFVGASKAHSLSPRFGIQYDANAKTRLRAAYSAATDELNAQNIESFEDVPVVFKQPLTTPIALVDGRGVMEKTRRFEFGVERALNGESSVEATAFFDTTSGRGLGIMSAPATAFGSEAGAGLINIANQQGAARGMRVVYSHRINRVFSASAGYSFGEGQQLSSKGITNPASLLENGFFQSAAMQVNANLNSGTHIRTVFRFSPHATVFAIDPFAGRLAVYDPSLSILVTQELPTFGLPIRAEALIDARNLLDVQASIEDGENTLSIFSPRRSLRGGIAVRF